MTPITSIATIDDLITSLLKVGYQKSTEYPTKYGTFFVNQCTGQSIPTVNVIILPKFKFDNRVNSLYIFERSEFFSVFEEIFISNDSRIVKNHFQHTLKVLETLSEHQCIHR